uniref:Uncharacterized protein n=1 Tax=Hyaloperonospora arabidopsidis (strain Emoy2) TaxID=559515 RepID=M4BJJ2_HYAAE
MNWSSCNSVPPLVLSEPIGLKQTWDGHWGAAVYDRRSVGACASKRRLFRDINHVLSPAFHLCSFSAEATPLARCLLLRYSGCNQYFGPL